MTAGHRLAFHTRSTAPAGQLDHGAVFTIHHGARPGEGSRRVPGPRISHQNLVTGNPAFDVVRCTRIDPFRSFTEVRPEEVFEWARRNVPPQSDAVFVGDNGLRTIGTIGALEAALRKPVSTTNQVAFWAALRAARVTIDSHDYGRIFNLA